MIVPILAILGCSCIAFILGALLTMRGAMFRLRHGLYRLMADGRLGTVDADYILAILEGRE